MSDYEKTYFERNNNRDNIAEIKAREYLSTIGEVCRFGFDEKEEPVENFWVIPKYIRKAPDFVLIKKNKPIFVECKGSTKVKVNDLPSYRAWSAHMPVKFFFYINSTGKMYSSSLGRMEELAQKLPKKLFPDNDQPYIDIPVDELNELGAK